MTFCTTFVSSEGVFLVLFDPSVNELNDLDRSMHRSLWVWVAHNSFIEGSLMTKNAASDYSQS